MSYCIAQGNLLNVRWQPEWEGCLWDKDTCLCMTESFHRPPETQNIVNHLYSNTKMKVFNKEQVMGMKKNWQSLQRKQEWSQ